MKRFLRFVFSRYQGVLKRMASSSVNKRASPTVYLQVLGTDTEDTTASLFLFANSQRYIFNCGEGTQRIFNEHKLRLGKIKNIFFTHVCWEYIGGLPGMAMTLRDNGKSDLGLYGPASLSDFINATRSFLRHEKLKFDCVGFTGEEVEENYEDENLTIWPVVLKKTKDEKSSFAETPMVEESSVDELHTSSQSSQDTCSSSCDGDEEPSSKRWKSDDKNSTVVCYICRLAPLPGKFFPKKAKDLGVPKGPLFGELQSGKTVTLEDGTQIHPEQVMEAAQPGPVLMIVDCPTVEYVPSLVSNERFTQYQAGGTQPAPVLIVHLTSLEIFKYNTEYEKWRNRFGDKVSHLLINKDVCATPLVFQKQAKIQCKLHCIDPEMFPLLHSTEIPVVEGACHNLPKNCVPGENFLQFHLRPVKQQGFDRSDIPEKLDVKSILNETGVLLEKKTEEGHCDGKETASVDSEISDSSGLRDASLSCEHEFKPNPVTRILQTVGEAMKRTICQNSAKSLKDFEVVFIGTGAAIPSKYRNVSSTLINSSESSSVLLDCGEGTYGQLYRHYGAHLDIVLQRLSCVFISHIHADHHLGLIRILQQRVRTDDFQGPPLLVIGPNKIQQWLYEYDSLCEDIDYRFVDSAELVSDEDNEHGDVRNDLEANQVQTVPVIHCPESYGLVLTHRTGWKLVYSGDTRPCPQLIQAGTGADLLIHEATLEDELESEAIDKMHSTTTEAIESGLKMEAKFIMLNHFSQRYPKIPVFSEQFTQHTGIAFDHMKVQSSNFSKIPQLLEPLKIIFAEEIDEMNKAK